MMAWACFSLSWRTGSRTVGAFRNGKSAAFKGGQLKVVGSEVESAGSRHQIIAGVAGRMGRAHDADYFIDVVQRQSEAEQNVVTVARLPQFEIGAAAHDIDAVFDEVLDGLQQAEFARLAVDDGEVDDAEADLQLGVFVEVIEDDLGLFAALQLENDAHAVAVAFIADLGNAFDPLLVDQRGGVFDQTRFIDLIRNFLDDDALAVLAHRLDAGLGANAKTAAAGAEGVEDALAAEDDAAGGEVGAFDDLDNFLERSVGLADYRDGGFDDLGEVVRRNIGRHADGDTGGTVNQQVGDAGGQDFGFLFAVIVVGAEIDGFFVDVFEQPGGDAGKAGFGVPHGRGRIAVHGAEVALAIHQRITHGETLRHADERIVNRRVAVGMEFAEDFADNLGALAGGAVGRKAHLAHAEQNAPVDGLEAVANVRQGASHDHAHGVIDIGPLHFVFDVYGDLVAMFIATTTAARKGELRGRRRTLRGIILFSHVFRFKPNCSRYLGVGHGFLKIGGLAKFFGFNRGRTLRPVWVRFPPLGQFIQVQQIFPSAGSQLVPFEILERYERDLQAVIVDDEAPRPAIFELHARDFLEHFFS